ncbi:MAG TPA: response regulator [Spirochaetota bacterium]|nr:response regulator [Spirochaetota bacterium]
MDDSRSTVLIVDDVPENISILNEILHKDHIVKAAINGSKAIEIATSKNPPDIILLDIMMPEMDGYEVCRILKENPKTKHIPIIFITALDDTLDEERGLSLGAVDYIKKPVNPSIVKRRIQTHLMLFDQNKILEKRIHERTLELEETRLAIVQRLGRAAEFKDNETGMHVIRVSNYCKHMALSDGVAPESAEILLHAAPMHDIGKIGIPDNILLKPGKLTPEEWKIMMTHPRIGADIIGIHDSEILKAAYTCALYHHEKFDGSGYPNGLKGVNIPYFARVIAIADVFDALTGERPYKRAWSIEEAVNHINEGSGTHFDPSLVDIFNREIDTILDIKKSYPELAVATES